MRTQALGSILLLFIAVPLLANDSRNATVYVYRPAAFTAMAKRPSIYVDGADIARLPSGTCLKFEVAPGQHSISSATYVDGRPNLNFESGREYFFQVKPRLARAAVGGPAMKLREVPQQEAVKEIEKLKEVDVNQPRPHHNRK
jgi:Protein of unknown function (DUF2846)